MAAINFTTIVTQGSSVEATLNKFGSYVVKVLQQSLRNSKGANTQLGQSISFSVEADGTQFTFNLLLPEYYKWVDEGRKPGKFPPADALLKWVISKNLKPINKGLKTSRSKKLNTIQQQKSLAYLIGRKISTKGIKPTGFYSTIINDELLRSLRTSLATALLNNTLNQFNNS